MNLFESLFDVSPDGGNGLLELVCFLGLVAGLGTILLRKRHHSRKI